MTTVFTGTKTIPYPEGSGLKDDTYFTTEKYGLSGLVNFSFFGADQKSTIHAWSEALKTDKELAIELGYENFEKLRTYVMCHPQAPEA